MHITGLVKTTTIDFPGRIAAAVFTAGCNYSCGYCQNKVHMAAPQALDEAQLWAFLEKRAGMLEGVVISGGEPTLQEDLLPFCRRLKMHGYEIKLDTNGSRPDVLAALLSEGLLSYVAMDYKAPWSRYREICGTDAAGVSECMAMLEQSGMQWEMRTTLIPQISTREAIQMAQAVPLLPKYALQLYRPVGDGESGLYTPGQVDEIGQRVKAWQPNTITRC